MLFIAALGIKYYTCNSVQSEQECVKLQELQTCLPSQHRCQTLFTTFNNGSIVTKEFVKQCSSGVTCNLTSVLISLLCKDPDRTCSHRYCDQDSCNESEYQCHLECN